MGALKNLPGNVPLALRRRRKGAAGDPGRTRTCNPLLRRQMLYPVELRGHYQNVILIPAAGCNENYRRSSGTLLFCRAEP